MREVLESATKQFKTLLVFRYGEHDLLYPESSTPVDIYVALGNEYITWEGAKAIPVPSISVELPDRDGTLDESECKIQVPLQIRQHAALRSMASSLSSTRTCYPVSVRVIQIVQSSESSPEMVRTLYRGLLQSVTRNPRGLTDVIEMEFKSGFRSRLADIALGRQANASCDLPFGQLCGALSTARMEIFSTGEYYAAFSSAHRGLKRNAWVTLTVDPLFPRRVTIAMDRSKHTAPPAEPDATRTLLDQPPGWWVGAMLCRNGLRIPVKEWRWAYGETVGTNVFILQKTPPEDWQGASVLLRLDCSHDYQACSARSNAERFGGLGIEIPSYNPTIEGPE